MGNRGAGCQSHWIREDAEVCVGEIVFGIENRELGGLMDSGEDSDVESGVGLAQD